MLFFVKVRIDVSRLPEFGRRLQAGEIMTHPLSTYCLKEDPAVGLNIWEAPDRAAFERDFQPHRAFYAEVMEISAVITPQESMQVLSSRS